MLAMTTNYSIGVCQLTSQIKRSLFCSPLHIQFLVWGIILLCFFVYQHCVPRWEGEEGYYISSLTFLPSVIDYHFHRHSEICLMWKVTHKKKHEEKPGAILMLRKVLVSD